MNWHVHDDTLDAYTSGRIDDASALSVEAHVLSCAACRHTLAGGVDPVRRDRIWNEIEDAIDAPRAGIAERVLIAFGVRAHVARLVVTAPSLGSAWLLAVAASLIFAAIASRAIADDPMPFLILAPLVPVVGVGSAFGRTGDPAWEIGLATPTGGLRLLLFRTAGVLAASMLFAGLAAVALPEPGWSAAAWLLPALAFTMLTLALSTTAMSATTAATVVGAGWLATVAVIERLATEPLASYGAAAQVSFAVLAVVSVAVVAARHAAFERPTQI